MRSPKRVADFDFHPSPDVAARVTSVDVAEYPQFRPPAFYAVVRYREGGTRHSGPWLTRTAANYLASTWWRRVVYALVKRGQTGNGDTCPLVPEHGNMWAMSSGVTQWCPNGYHSQRGTESRSSWPLDGFETAVRTHFIQLEKAKAGALPDLTDLEVL